jgi:tetratricopeptide (TPR) repeat protein
VPYSICARLPGALLILLVSACATAPQSLELIHHPPTNLSSGVELVDVPFFPQSEYQCGPASLATVLEHKGINIGPDRLIDQVYIPEREGSLQIEMIATARNFGLLGYKIPPELKNILLEIDHGNPVLVFQNLALDVWPKWHYAVAIGYDLKEFELILRSGTFARHTVSFSTFEKTWQRADYWAYVFTNVGEIPYTATPTEHIKASYELQQVKGMDLAIKAFRSGVKKWPEDSLVLISLANAEYTVGNWQNAIDYLQKEISLRPDNSTAWNNIAYALSANNCKEQAILAVECALELAPDNENIRHSWLEIQQTTAENTQGCMNISCPVQHGD